MDRCTALQQRVPPSPGPGDTVISGTQRTQALASRVSPEQRKARRTLAVTLLHSAVMQKLDQP